MRQKKTYFERAYRIYCRWEARMGYVHTQPVRNDGYYKITDTNPERRYVVLDNINGLLACYRIRPCGRLRKLIRIPKPILSMYA